MFLILDKRELNDSVMMMDIQAPLIARKAKAGQFIIFRIDETGERVPLTIAGWDAVAGSVTIIFQVVGKATRQLSQMNPGETILDFVGPLGEPSQLDGYKKACVIGGGVGNAIALPSARTLHVNGAHVDVIMGFRNKDIVILEEEMRAVCANLYITTDDGSYGRKGFVTDQLKELLEGGEDYDLVIAIGPVPMMKFVCDLTKGYGIKTLVSLNPIMIDGTGMCGGCRVTVGGEKRFACVDGPEFDGHEVDFNELMLRNALYRTQEREDDEDFCRIGRSKPGDRTGTEG